MTEVQDTHAFEPLVAAHRAALARLARRLARDPEDAEDLLQETLVDAYRAFGNFRPDSRFYTWVARIMTNNQLDRVRRRRHLTVSLDGAAAEDGEPLEFPDESANPERVVLHEAMGAPYDSALEALQPMQRATVLLCDIEGATYEEAAAVEACPIGTIRSRLHRAHKAIRDFLVSLDPRADPLVESSASRLQSRRAFLQVGAAAAGAALTGGVEALAAGPTRVLISAGGDTPGLREAIAAEDVRVAFAADARLGLSDAALRETDVLIWLGDRDLAPDRAAAIARRVRDGGMGLIVLHAGGGGPLPALLGAECAWPAPALHEEGPLALRVTAPRHPVARGLESFTMPRAQRFTGVFHGPKPDVLVFDNAAAGGERAPQGMAWSIGRGRVFHFQPGHPAHAAYLQNEVRTVLRNAVAWTGRGAER